MFVSFELLQGKLNLLVFFRPLHMLIKFAGKKRYLGYGPEEKYIHLVEGFGVY